MANSPPTHLLVGQRAACGTPTFARGSTVTSSVTCARCITSIHMADAEVREHLARRRFSD